MLRHWESCGLLSPPRDASGRRLYGEDEHARIAAVQLAKEAGLSLGAIRALLTTSAADTRQAELLAHRDALREHATRIAAELELVECALRCPHEDLAGCPNFRELVDERAGGGPAPRVTRGERPIARPSGGAGGGNRTRAHAATEGEP